MDERGRVFRRQPGFSDEIEFLEVTGVDGLRSKLNLQARFREPSCNFFAKEAWERLGGYTPEFRFIMDFDFTVRMLSRFPCASWNRCLVRLRRHATSDGATLPIELAMAETRTAIRKIETLLGADLDSSDRAAARAYLLYKLLELCTVALRRRPAKAVGLWLRNLDLCASGVGAWLRLARLVRNRIRLGDPQQKVRLSTC
jgi:hypothetical protein